MHDDGAGLESGLRHQGFEGRDLMIRTQFSTCTTCNIPRTLLHKSPTIDISMITW